MTEDVKTISEFPTIKGGAAKTDDAMSMFEHVPAGVYVAKIERIDVVPAGTYATTFKSSGEDTLDFIVRIVEPKAHAGSLLKKSFVRMTINQGGRGFKPSALYTIAKAAMPEWDGKELNVKNLIGKEVQVVTVDKKIQSTGKSYSAITDFLPVPEDK